MSLTEKLLLNINEYTDLLKFLDDSHPDILKEWKIKVALATNQSSTGPVPEQATILGLTKDDQK